METVADLATVAMPPKWSPTIPAAAIGRVLAKVADGTYPTEAVRCFCGADFDDLVVTEYDRFFIPHRMVLCRACCLIRATPRMTAAAYAAFYNDEYRPIYDSWQFQARYGDQDYLFMRQVNQGVKFKEFTDHFGIVPKTVIDLGCNMGAMLQPFQDEGATVHGVDLCQASTDYGRSRGLPLRTGTLDSLLADGIQADLILMQDFVEHLLDLQELGKIRRLLAPGGVLYIGTPGLFRWKLNVLFQNAHPYLFIGASLQYVMGQFGFEELYLDEEITSLWTYTGAETNPVPKPAGWIKYIDEHLRQLPLRTLPPVRSINKFPQRQLVENMAVNLAQRRPDLSAITRTRAGSAVIIGGGPSVDDQLDTIRAKVAEGAALIAIERMYPWCVAQGLHADFVMSMDCSDGVEAGFSTIQDGTIHILSVATHPALFTLLKDAPVYVFNGHTAPSMKIQDLWLEHGYTRVTVLNTGGSVVLGCHALAVTLGYRDLHVFGFDCMVSPERAYSAGIAGESLERHYFPVQIDGQEYLTCASFLSFARSFYHFKAEALAQGLLDTVTVYGESLINKMAEPDVPDTVPTRAGSQ